MRPFRHTQMDPLLPHFRHGGDMLSVRNSISLVGLNAICGVHGTTIRRG